MFSSNAKIILCKRYFHRGPGHTIPCTDCGILHETEDEFLDRVSLYNLVYRQRLIEPLKFLPNSPTLFNLPCKACGETEPSGSLSACFKFDVPDSMDGIMDTAHKSAMVQKYGGGVGYYLGDVRAKGSPIRTTHKVACGPVQVIRHYQSLSQMITQGGRRPGAQMAILNVDHPDIREFIHMKDKDPDSFYTFNISVALTDDFIDRVRTGLPAALRLWNEIAESSYITGDPGCYFTDISERTNPTPEYGKLTATNPCGEFPSISDEACNLGSINLAVLDGMDSIENTSKLATRYLNDVLERNKFPHERITEAVRKTRKLGLGVMGWADYLAQRGIAYDSIEALDEAQKIMSLVNSSAHSESKKAVSKYGIIGNTGRANATLTTIAPTGSIAILAGCSSGIEPHFNLEWNRTVADGTVLRETAGFFDGFIPKIAEDIPWQWHVAQQAVFQRNVDLGVSKTINMREDATVEEIGQAYMRMWEEECKGGTVYRNNCRENQVLRIG